jgi:hypothetical protein
VKKRKKKIRFLQGLPTCQGFLMLWVGERIYQDKQVGEAGNSLGRREAAAAEHRKCCCSSNRRVG